MSLASSATAPDRQEIVKDDAYYMSLAISVARRALHDQGEVPVGCILVDNATGHVVSHGANQVNACRDATRHAEMVAFDRLLNNSRSTDHLRLPESYLKSKQMDFRARESSDDTTTTTTPDSWSDTWTQYEHGAMTGWGVTEFGTQSLPVDCTLYVTCEPCIMCAGAIRQMQNRMVRRTVFGCRNDKFGGCGSILPILVTDDSMQVTGGVLEDECVSMLRQFYKGENLFAPESKRRRKDDQRQVS